MFLHNQTPYKCVEVFTFPSNVCLIKTNTSVSSCSFWHAIVKKVKRFQWQLCSYFSTASYSHLDTMIIIDTRLPYSSALVKAPVYDSEAMHQKWVQCALFMASKNSGRFVCKCMPPHRRDMIFCYEFDHNFYIKMANFEPRTCLSRDFKPSYHFIELRLRIRHFKKPGCIPSRFFALKSRTVSYISACTTMITSLYQKPTFLTRYIASYAIYKLS